jgi:hypothetical protein
LALHDALRGKHIVEEILPTARYPAICDAHASASLPMRTSILDLPIGPEDDQVHLP